MNKTYLLTADTDIPYRDSGDREYISAEAYRIFTEYGVSVCVEVLS